MAWERKKKNTIFVHIWHSAYEIPNNQPVSNGNNGIWQECCSIYRQYIWPIAFLYYIVKETFKMKNTTQVTLASKTEIYM